MKHSFQEVMDLDYILYQLSVYEVTHGKIVLARNIKETMRFQNKIVCQFNYFKNMIQRGSCTLEFIKSTVLKKNGPFSRIKGLDTDDSSDIDRLIEETKVLPETDKTMAMLDDFLARFLSELPDIGPEEQFRILSIDKNDIAEIRRPPVRLPKKIKEHLSKSSKSSVQPAIFKGMKNKKKRPWWSPEKWVMILFPKVGLDFLIPKKLKEEKKEK